MESQPTTISPVSKAGRPRCFCPDKALDRALEVFWKNGYDGTSLTDLTEAMGINRPSLYAAYGNKEELFRKAMQRYSDRIACLLKSADQQPTARAYVEFLLNKSVEFFTDPNNPGGCFMIQGPSGSCGHSKKLLDEVNACRTGLACTFRKRFQQALDDGEFAPATDVDGLAEFFAAVKHGMALQAAAGATADGLRAVVSTAMRAWPNPPADAATNR